MLGDKVGLSRFAAKKFIGSDCSESNGGLLTHLGEGQGCDSCLPFILRNGRSC